MKTLLIYIAGILAFIVFSALTSIMEMAYSSANRIRLEHAAEDGSRSARLAVYICSRYEDMLSTALIINNLVNIGASALASLIAITIANGKNEAVITTATATCATILILLFGETLPKIIANKNANSFAISIAYVTRALMLLLKPLIFIIVSLTKLLTSPFKGEKPESEQDAAVEELVSIIDTVEGEGVIDEERSELLHAAIDFADTAASEIMTSRVDMLAIDIDDDWGEIFELIQSSPYSRLPVYEDSIDNIIGTLYLNHFFKAVSGMEKIDLRPILIKPCYVYKTLKLPAVLAEMRKCKTHLAIVTDEYGGSMGIVSMEDVFEELVGEIWDETDEIEEEVIEHDGGVYELDGDMSMGDFLEMLDRDEDSIETDSSTVGGWTIENFGYFPEAGESFVFENLTVVVLDVAGQRVESVLVMVEER